MIATALEYNGAERVYIVGRRKDILENAAKEHSVRNPSPPRVYILGFVLTFMLRNMVRSFRS